MTVRRNQPARNPREGVLQNLKKERKGVFLIGVTNTSAIRTYNLKALHTEFDILATWDANNILKIDKNDT